MDSIIFDVDGTLWDSTGIVAEAWSDYLIHTEHMDTDVSAKRLMGLFGQLLPDIARLFSLSFRKQNSFVSSTAAARQSTKHCFANVLRCIRILRKH